jgi:hypothetical protein
VNIPGLYVLPFGDWVIALTYEEFQAALERGRELVESTATGSPSGAPEPLLTAAEIAAVTPGIPSAWYLEHARQGQIPYVKLGRYIRFRLGRIIEHGAVTPPVTPAGKWTRGT